MAWSHSARPMPDDDDSRLLAVVLGNAEGTEVANLHAGWRGLAGGIVENTIAAMQTKPTWAWLGAAISQPCFEIGQK
jgi:Uncharacterized conserved protein